MKRKFIITALACTMSSSLWAFCGFYVAKADANLFNKKSEVILVRDGNYTTITMSNDFEGEVKDFAMVIPIPSVIDRSAIKIVERSLFNTLDAYSAPRLVEYYDQNPCGVERRLRRTMAKSSMNFVPITDDLEIEEDSEGVTIEARYEVDEYEILILSAKESTGLKSWLLSNGYKIPATADEVLDPYIKNGLKFFVVKVNLQKYNPALNNGYLRPIQITVNTDRFMLPIRLGMANSTGEQDMIVYAFTKEGRIESTNYRTEKIPSNQNVPTFIRANFGPFYKQVFDMAHERSGSRSVFLEYAWNVSPSWSGVKCDPCVGNPPYFNELTSAGVNWLGSGESVFFTRLHVRYGRENFPEDLFFQISPNKEHFQGRYILTHATTGETQCPEAGDYWRGVRKRRQNELLNMASITGWDPMKHSDYIFTGSTNSKMQMKQGSLIPLPQEKGKRGPMILLFLSLSLLATYLIKSAIKRFT